MKLAYIEKDLDVYGETMKQYVDTFQLPKSWFGNPDHLAVKCADELDYIDTCISIGNDAIHDGVWEVSLDERLLASAKLSGKVALGGFHFGWIEIMQPRPGKETGKGFVEHTEFFYPDLYEVLRVLEQCGADVALQSNPGHEWVNLVIDDFGREIKFNNKPLAEVVAVEQAEGVLRRIA